MIGEVVPVDEREAACQVLVREWRTLEDAYVRGDRSGSAPWVPGCPVRVSPAGVGGDRWLVEVREPISWELRSSVSEKHLNVERVSLVKVDKLQSHMESSSQRSEQPSAGGDMAAYSSKSGAKRDSLPLWSPRAMRIHGVGPSVNGSNDGEYGQIS